MTHPQEDGRGAEAPQPVTRLYEVGLTISELGGETPQDAVRTFIAVLLEDFAPGGMTLTFVVVDRETGTVTRVQAEARP